MAEVSARHKFVTVKPDGPDPGLVRASKWNQDHRFAGGVSGQGLERNEWTENGASWEDQSRGFTWVLAAPVVGGIPGPRLKENSRVVRVDSYVTAETSVSFNVERRAVIGIPGVDLLSGEQVAVVSGVNSESFAETSLDAGEWLWLDISAVVGSPGMLVVTLACVKS